MATVFVVLVMVDVGVIMTRMMMMMVAMIKMEDEMKQL